MAKFLVIYFLATSCCRSYYLLHMHWMKRKFKWKSKFVRQSFKEIIILTTNSINKTPQKLFKTVETNIYVGHILCQLIEYSVMFNRYHRTIYQFIRQVYTIATFTLWANSIKNNYLVDTQNLQPSPTWKIPRGRCIQTFKS